MNAYLLKLQTLPVRDSIQEIPASVSLVSQTLCVSTASASVC